MILKDLLRQAPEKFQAQSGPILPIAFIARSDEEADVASVWSDVWEEGGSSLRLYVSDIVQLVLQGSKSLTKTPLGGQCMCRRVLYHFWLLVLTCIFCHITKFFIENKE
jgi:hypothetical protein